MAIDRATMFKLSYGLFVLTTRDDTKDNACIINTAVQLTEQPHTLSITVNKASYTCGIVERTKRFNLSILTQDAPFELFKQFGFQSGKDVDKFASVSYQARAENGIRYLPHYTNGIISGEVIQSIDCGTHMLFIASITDAFLLSDEPSATYQYYFDHIKPKPNIKLEQGFICKICGYIFHGDVLPDDYICPLCKHGADAFEAITLQERSETTMKYVCDVCGWIYDEAAGAPDNGIAPGTKWENLPDDFSCPLCGASKDRFSKVE